jgi:2-polyprenyl-3-methyl-5-hydroxy-6-metoxy-1,4-benzoquinol methylase
MAENNKDVGEFFSSFSDDWDTLYGEKRNPFMRSFDSVFRKDVYQRYELTFQALGEDLKGSTILDIGCGNGIYSLDAIQNGATKVLGVDVADQMIGLCKKVANERKISQGLNFEVSNFPVSEDMKMRIGSFDYSIVMGVMDYVYDPAPFLKQLREVTDKEAYITFPGGKFIRYNIRKYRYKLLGRVHVMGYTSEGTITKLLNDAGFNDVSIDYLRHSGGCYFVRAK